MSSPPLRALVVEDEVAIREGLELLLRASGFDPVCVSDGRAALESFARGSLDVVVLDLMIPPPTGLEVLREIRKASRAIPVLVLTAKDTEEDVVAGLEAGADDYMTKPFGTRELVARIRGLVRRASGLEQAKSIVSLSDASIDFGTLQISSGDVAIALTAREGNLLEYLLTHRDRIVTREELLVQVWGYRDGKLRTRTVDVHLQQLRAKLRPIRGAEDWIATIRGRGYRFVGAG